MNIKKEQPEHESFWRIRSANYDRLYWTKDRNYLKEIALRADLHEDHVVLDVGTGTGAVARAVKDQVHHVVSIDTSDAMLDKGNWEGTSVVKWDINEALFTNGVFDRVFARMVFHHILDNLTRAILRCYDLLKTSGKIIVAEGVPPTDDPEVIAWYTEMFRLKEERRTFTPDLLAGYLKKTGFNNVESSIYIMEDFSIKNWLENSGLPLSSCDQIMQMHRQASPAVKEAYNMRLTDDDCLVRTKNVIIVGEK